MNFIHDAPLLPPVESRYIQALLSLVELLYYWALIGGELDSDEIFAGEWPTSTSQLSSISAQPVRTGGPR